VCETKRQACHCYKCDEDCTFTGRSILKTRQDRRWALGMGGNRRTSIVRKGVPSSSRRCTRVPPANDGTIQDERQPQQRELAQHHRRRRQTPFSRRSRRQQPSTLVAPSSSNAEAVIDRSRTYLSKLPVLDHSSSRGKLASVISPFLLIILSFLCCSPPHGKVIFNFTAVLIVSPCAPNSEAGVI
jgi:hypothetical protein